MKNFLKDLGLVEDSSPQVPKTPKSKVSPIQPSVPQTNFSTSIEPDQEFIDKVLKIIDIHEGYSFIEFFVSNKDSSNLQSGLKTLFDMSKITAEELKSQGLETMQKLDDFVSDSSNTLNGELNEKITEANEKRTSLTNQISDLEQKILQLKTEMSGIDVSDLTRDVQEKIEKLRVTSAHIRGEIQSFLNKF